MTEDRSWFWIVVVLIAALALGGWIYYARQRVAATARTHAVQTAAPTAASGTVHAERAPSPATSAVAPLPALSDDGAIMHSLTALPGASALGKLLRPPLLIQHIVATVIALPGRSLGEGILPVHRPSGAFQVSTADGHADIAYGNATRYEPYMQLIDSVPVGALVAWYRSMYPLFQQAYQGLGYPHGAFNDRLIATIDNLLAAPDRATPPRLVRGPHGTWNFANPALQGLSIGQRMLLRTGAADEATIKGKLRAMRAELVAGEPRH